jgi:hypothetical protein
MQTLHELGTPAGGNEFVLVRRKTKKEQKKRIKKKTKINV